MVPAPVALDRRRVGSPRLVDHRDHLALRHQDPVGIGEDHLRVDQLLAGQDHRPGGECCLLGDAERPPGVGAALEVRPLDVEDGQVGPKRRHPNQPLHQGQVRV